jgi:hypothetical protein
MRKKTLCYLSAVLLFTFGSCKSSQKEENTEMQKKVNQFALVDLKTDLSHLSDNQKQMLLKLIEVGDIMDNLFWKDAFTCNKDEFLKSLPDDATREFAQIMYGPWDRMKGNESFVKEYGEKPLGANYYPLDITAEEFEAWDEPNKMDWYSLVRRDECGTLKMIPYHVAYKEEIKKAAELLRQAAELAEDAGFKKYLELRAEAFETDDYLASDLAWMDMTDNLIDFVAGPIESYEDQLVGARAAHSAQILIKDVEWSKKLDKYGELLPKLQQALPCDDKYKKEKTQSVANMCVYDAILYRGDCNSGSKTIAINLPNDDRVQKAKGARRLQLRNSMEAKFDKILMPIGELVLNPDLHKYLKFDSFFWNVTFHEVAHGLGIKETVNGKGSVDEALKTEKTSWEEAKADILGLFMVCNLIEKGEITNITIEDAITTYIAGILRSVRFGAASSHGKANMMCYNYMEKYGAFSRNEKNLYNIDFEKSKESINSWAALILKTQGEGDFEFAQKYREENGVIGTALQADLDKIGNANIPRDIRFEQGMDVLRCIKN